jgi:transcriptional regulator with XRE-family HTH domain
MSGLGNKEILAKNLNYYIGKSGKDRRQLAEIWGVPYSTLTNWVTAKKYPRIDKIEIMADYFGILKSELIEEKIEDAINDRPVEMAELHFEMIMDEDLNDIFKYFKDLDDRERQLVKDLVRSMAERKKTEA